MRELSTSRILRRSLGPLAAAAAIAVPAQAVEIDVDCAAGENLERAVAVALDGQRAGFASRLVASRGLGSGGELTVNVRGECAANLYFEGPYEIRIVGEGPDVSTIVGELDGEGAPEGPVIGVWGGLGLEIENLTLRRGTQGVRASHSSDLLSLQNVSVEDAETGLLFESARAELDGIEVSGCDVGVRSFQGSNVRITDSTFSGIARTGVAATSSSFLKLTGSTVSTDSGVGLQGTRSQVWADESEIDAGGDAVTGYRSAVIVEDTTVRSQNGYAVLASDQSELQVEDDAEDPAQPTLLEGHQAEPESSSVLMDTKSYLEMFGGEIAGDLDVDTDSAAFLLGGTVTGNVSVLRMSGLTLMGSGSDSAVVQGDLSCSLAGDAVNDGGTLEGTADGCASFTQPGASAAPARGPAARSAMPVDEPRPAAAPEGAFGPESGPANDGDRGGSPRYWRGGRRPVQR